MDDIMRSSSTEAERESNAILGKEAAVKELAELTINMTNLPVVENLQGMLSKMNTCNDKYKNLLKNHADCIKKLGQEFDDFDKELSEKIGVIR